MLKGTDSTEGLTTFTADLITFRKLSNLKPRSKLLQEKR